MKKGYFCKIQSVSKFNFQQIMADKKAQESLDPEVKIQSAIGNTENFIMRNGRKLLIALASTAINISLPARAPKRQPR